MLANSDKHIFISHSARYLQLVEWFRRRFDGTGVEPRFMEYLSWRKREKPNWSWIKSEIEKSTALMLILSRNIVNREHTQNWVAYEIGVRLQITNMWWSSETVRRKRRSIFLCLTLTNTGQCLSLSSGNGGRLTWLGG